VPPPRSIAAVKTWPWTGERHANRENRDVRGLGGKGRGGDRGAWGSRTAHLAMAQVLFFLVVIPPVRLLVGLGPLPMSAAKGRDPKFRERAPPEAGAGNLAAEAIEGAALALESIDDVHGGNGLAAGVLGVGNGIADDVLEEHLEDRASLLVDEARDTLHATTTSETADSGLGDALDVVAQHLPVALGAALAETLTALATSGHFF
jgi:hypothetical protein